MKIKIMVPATPAALFYSFDRFFLRAPSARSGAATAGMQIVQRDFCLRSAERQKKQTGRAERGEEGNKARFIVSPVAATVR